MREWSGDHECFTRSYDTILCASVETGLVHALLAVLNHALLAASNLSGTPLNPGTTFFLKAKWNDCQSSQKQLIS